MKRNLILFSLLNLMMVSCSSDIEKTVSYPISPKSQPAPVGVTNPYEANGIMFGNIYEQLLDNQGVYNLEGLLVFSLQSTAFNLIYQNGYVTMSETELIAISSQSEAGFNLIRPAIGLTDPAFDKLSDVVAELIALKNIDADYQTVAAFLTESELQIINMNAITLKDKEVLLITMSIVKHRLEVEYRKRRKDRDWPLSIGHIAATAYGASLSEANAVVSGLYPLFNT